METLIKYIFHALGRKYSLSPYTSARKICFKINTPEIQEKFKNISIKIYREWNMHVERISSGLALANICGRKTSCRHTSCTASCLSSQKSRYSCLTRCKIYLRAIKSVIQIFSDMIFWIKFNENSWKVFDFPHNARECF